MTIFNMLIVSVFLTMPSIANAYIDPGTGSLIVQVIIAAFATALITIKMWWYKASKVFRLGKNNKDSKVKKAEKI